MCYSNRLKVYQTGSSVRELKDTEGVQSGDPAFKLGKLTLPLSPLTLPFKKIDSKVKFWDIKTKTIIKKKYKK